VRQGLHVHEDHFLPEIIDPSTGQTLPDGEEGELVLTTLTKEAVPLIRYRTGDLSSVDRSKCGCGRTLARMSAVRGRRDDMLIIRGVNLYPSEIERIILGVEGVAPYYQIVVDRPHDLDRLTVRCEAATQDPVLSDRVRHALHEGTGLSVEVELLPAVGVPRSEGKAVRVIDRRSR
jgi:phenylacetate-CoA ligase